MIRACDPLMVVESVRSQAGQVFYRKHRGQNGTKIACRPTSGFLLPSRAGPQVDGRLCSTFTAAFCNSARRTRASRRSLKCSKRPTLRRSLSRRRTVSTSSDSSPATSCMRRRASNKTKSPLPLAATWASGIKERHWNGRQGPSRHGVVIRRT